MDEIWEKKGTCGWRVVDLSGHHLPPAKAKRMKTLLKTAQEAPFGGQTAGERARKRPRKEL